MKRCKFFALLCMLFVFACMFLSCGGVAEEPRFAKIGLERQNYRVTVEEVDNEYGKYTLVVGVKNSKNLISINYFEDEADAEAAYQRLEENEDYYKDLWGEDIEYGIDDCIVWIGSPEAIKAAR